MSTFLSNLSPYLPQHPGFLPHWLLFVGAIAVGNTAQAYLTMSFTTRMYPGPPSPALPRTPSSPKPNNSPATPLASHLFGTWTLLQGLVRIYAAYNIDNAGFYQLAFMAYAIAFTHFMSEWLVFGNMRCDKGLAVTVPLATFSMVWMVLQYGFYVK